MPFHQYLSPADITALHTAAVDAGLTGHRASLLGGIPPAYAASLPMSASPAAQLLGDLHLLNAVDALADGSVPLQRWLVNARDLTTSRPESALFQRALARLSPPAEAAPRTPLPPHAPAYPARRPLPAAPFPASTAFLSIAGLQAMDGPDVQAAMEALHRALRAAVAPLALPDLVVLSSLTGAIVLVPDALNRNVHDLLPDWIRAAGAAGLGIRAGVSRSLVEMTPDADGTMNAIGRCINVAARLAVSSANPGVLYEQGYVTHVQAMLRDTHFLHPGHPNRQQPISVKGKRTEVFTCFADPDHAVRNPVARACDGTPAFANAILLAYDLPDFSDGYLRTLVSRVRAVAQEVQRLRDEHNLPGGAGLSFSPGGDGGVLALTQVPLGRALGLATDLAKLLDAAGSTQSPEAPVKARIGVHYGQVLSYENAEGVTRPTGHALFDADRIAGDDEARRYNAVVVSGALIESAAQGLREAERFDEIGPLTTAQGATIRRYVPRGAPRR